MNAWENFNQLAESVTNEIIEGIQNENLTWEQVWSPKTLLRIMLRTVPIWDSMHFGWPG